MNKRFQYINCVPFNDDQSTTTNASPRQRLFTIGALLLGIAVLATACASSYKPAPDIEFTPYQNGAVVAGKTSRLSDLRGKPVVLNFWAGACPPCRAEMLEFQNAHEEHKGHLIILGIDVGPFTSLGSRDQGRALLKELGITYPTGTPLNNQVVLDYKIIGMPTTVFITPDGDILRTWTGLLDKDTLRSIIEELL